MQSYSSTVLPIIFAVWLQIRPEKRLDAWFHYSFGTVFTPLVALAIMMPFTLITIGPVGGYVGEAIAYGLQSIYDFSPIAAGIIITMPWQVLVIQSVHWGLVPVFINKIMVRGAVPLSVSAFPAVLSQVGAALGIILRLRSAQPKALAFK